MGQKRQQSTLSIGTIIAIVSLILLIMFGALEWDSRMRDQIERVRQEERTERQLLEDKIEAGERRGDELKRRIDILELLRGPDP